MTDPVLRALDALGGRMDDISRQQADITQQLRKITDVLERLARVEERASEASRATERAFDAIGELDDRVSREIDAANARLSEVEKHLPGLKEKAGWFVDVVKLAFVSACTAIATWFSVRPPGGPHGS